MYDPKTHLKEIIKSDTALLGILNTIEPITFKSVRLFCNEIGANSDEVGEEVYNHFVKDLKKLNPYDKGLEYISAESGKLERLNVIENDVKIYNTNITVSSVKKLKNDYEITTYSPFYSYFVLKNYQWILVGNHGNTSIIERYDKIFDMIDLWKAGSKPSGKNDYTQLSSLGNKFLFYYLVEKHLAFRYKYYVYKYVEKFLEEFNINFPGYDGQNSMLVKDYYIMHLIYIFAKFSLLSVFTTKDFFDCVYKIFINITVKHDKENIMTPLLEEELIPVFNEIFDYSNSLDLNDTSLSQEGAARILAECNETNNYIIKPKLIPYWYNIQYVVNAFNTTKTDNHQDLFLYDFSDINYRKNFPFNEYYLFEARLNRQKI